MRRNPRRGERWSTERAVRPRCVAVIAISLFALSIVMLCPAVFAKERSTPSLPAAFRALEGSWEGSGKLLGRPGRFRMRWTLGERNFVYLDYSNARLDEQGQESPVLTSHAVYLIGDSSAVGAWLDDRPQRVSLKAVFTDSSVVTTWTAEAEKGRTEYTVRSPAIVVVRDFVSVKGTERLFAEATYHRDTGAPKD